MKAVQVKPIVFARCLRLCQMAGAWRDGGRSRLDGQAITGLGPVRPALLDPPTIQLSNLARHLQIQNKLLKK